jgi:hypothetical protein
MPTTTPAPERDRSPGASPRPDVSWRPRCGAVQDQLDRDLHLRWGIEAVGVGHHVPEPSAAAAGQDLAEEGNDGKIDLLLGGLEPGPGPRFGLVRIEYTVRKENP